MRVIDATAEFLVNGKRLLEVSRPYRLSRCAAGVCRLGDDKIFGTNGRVPTIMPPVGPFHSLNEAKKPPAHRVYHNNGACGPGRDIAYRERISGMGGYRLCDDCDRLNRLGR